jgi:hypothetical protein
MEKSQFDSLAASVKDQQLAAAKAITQLKRELSPGNLANLGKDKAADAVKAATLEPTGRPKAWVLIATVVSIGLLGIAILVRLTRNKK